MIETNPIEYWASLGNIKMLQEFLDSGLDVNSRGDNGYTGLHAAVVNEQEETVIFLLESGANVELKLDSGEKAIDLAVLTGNSAIVGILR